MAHVAQANRSRATDTQAPCCTGALSHQLAFRPDAFPPHPRATRNSLQSCYCRLFTAARECCRRVVASFISLRRHTTSCLPSSSLCAWLLRAFAKYDGCWSHGCAHVGGLLTSLVALAVHLPSPPRLARPATPFRALFRPLWWSRRATLLQPSNRPCATPRFSFWGVVVVCQGA